ncbi:MAG TPA: hypothetical protein PKM65_18635 [Spirochaetota bacterium]|nr:hypothetical protein [Spirochaetota bacterium]HNT13028.1 hypothetical protein [Spirochaetota bacterium]
MKRIAIAVLFFFAVGLAAQQNYQKSTAMSFKLKSISASKNGPSKIGMFRSKQVVWLNIEIIGLRKDADNNFSFQSDLTLNDPDKQTILNVPNILNQQLNAPDANTVVANYNINLGGQMKPGKYDVTIVFRDVNAVTYSDFKASFFVSE